MNIIKQYSPKLLVFRFLIKPDTYLEYYLAERYSTHDTLDTWYKVGMRIYSDRFHGVGGVLYEFGDDVFYDDFIVALKRLKKLVKMYQNSQGE